jgi:sulfatase maturation enzyme AslB (radical SAM superfamily)
LPSKLELIVPTNGLLIDSGLAGLFAKYNVLIVLGIDGSPIYNNVTRCSKRGEPTSSAVEDIVRLLREYGVRLAASVTLTPSNVHASDDHRSYLADQGIIDIGFNVLKGVALRNSLGTMTTSEYYRAAAEAVASGYKENGYGIQEYQLNKKLNALIASQPFSIDCTCCGNQLVVQADGMVTNCPFLPINLGHVQSLPVTFRIAETDTVQSWRRRVPLLIEGDNGSINTPFLHGGGCAWSMYELYGNPVRYDNDNELFNSEVMYALIWKRLPQRARECLLSREIAYWNHRGIGSL